MEGRECPRSKKIRCGLSAQVSRAEGDIDALLSFTLWGKVHSLQRTAAFTDLQCQHQYPKLESSLAASDSQAISSLGRTAKSKGRWGNAPDCLPQKGLPLTRLFDCSFNSSIRATTAGQKVQHFECLLSALTISIPCKALFVLTDGPVEWRHLHSEYNLH